jgi:miniconductance mechanosensitive channel
VFLKGDAMFNNLIEGLSNVRELINSWHVFPRTVTQVLLIFGVSILSYIGCRLAFRYTRYKILKHQRYRPIAQIILQSNFFPRLLWLVPLILLDIFTGTLLNEGMPQAVLIKINRIFFYFSCAYVFAAILSLVYRLINWHRGVEESPQKGLFQVLSVLGYIFATVIVIADLTGHDPTYVLSGMTALSAVLMLIFKDSILGLTAGVTLAGNGMIRLGDWIQVPGADADGSVIDITLTSVRVENWDKTVTTVPAYNLISSPFKNWRNMFEKGGRRIKRSIWIDVDSVTFATDEMLDRWKKINILRQYLAEKLKEVREYNNRQSAPTASIANTRKLTNIGTFRAYCLAYLQSLPGVNQEMLILVRQLQPTDCGLPLEIYCFTKDTSWTTYERVQSDIFDHLLAILPEFGLRYFQVVSASSMRSMYKE